MSNNQNLIFYVVLGNIDTLTNFLIFGFVFQIPSDKRGQNDTCFYSLLGLASVSVFWTLINIFVISTNIFGCYKACFKYNNINEFVKYDFSWIEYGHHPTIFLYLIFCHKDKNKYNVNTLSSFHCNATHEGSSMLTVIMQNVYQIVVLL